MRPRMLVTRIGAFGDVCMLVPIVYELQRYFDIDWLIRDCYRPVVQGFDELQCRTIGVNPAPNGIISPDDPLVERLRARNYDYCLDFSHWPVVSRLISRLPEIAVRAITRDPLQDALLDVNPSGMNLEQSFNRVVDVDPTMHQIEKWRTLIRESCGLDLDLHWPLPPQRSSADVLRIFVHPHAGKSDKIWPARRFAAILSKLARRRPIDCVINGGCGSQGRSVLWRLLLSGCSCKSAPIDPSFQTLRQQLQQADLAIGCDSGPMHFASLMGTTTMVIYGPYSPREFRPLWRSTSVVPDRDKQPAWTISTKQVQTQLDGLVDQLESSAESSRCRVA